MTNSQQDAELVRRILAVLDQGLLAARMAGWQNEASKASDIADTLHNMPELATRLIEGGAAADGVDRGWLDRDLARAEERFHVRRRRAA